MRFDIVVGAELERSEGKFVSRDELRDQLIEALEEANPGDLMGENDGQYMVETWEVEEQEQPSAQELRRRKQLHTDRKTLRDVLERPSNADAKSIAIPRKLLERLALPREDPPAAPAEPPPHSINTPASPEELAAMAPDPTKTTGVAVLLKVGNSIWHAVSQERGRTVCGIAYEASQMRRTDDWYDLAQRPKPLTYTQAGQCPECLRAAPCSDGSSDKEAS